MSEQFTIEVGKKYKVYKNSITLVDAIILHVGKTYILVKDVRDNSTCDVTRDQIVKPE